MNREQREQLIKKQIFEVDAIKTDVVITLFQEVHRFEFNNKVIDEIYSKDDRKLSKKEKTMLKNYENNKKRFF